ncbi:MAG: ATP phosphoribosyltransferase regulatory subunit [bacterium]|nr:ATP phosphoribosyltransferase regulatory subunit [bacterium]
MDIRYRRPRGTRDVLLEEMERWRWCEERWREVLERYGFGEIRTPLIEPTDLFTRAVGSGTDIVDKEMYSFETKGGEQITLRPEATASVVRAYLENGLTRQPGTLKFYYLGPMFRYDRPQAGRYRQFHQLGVEAIGSPSPVLDAEVIRAGDVPVRRRRCPGPAGPGQHDRLSRVPARLRGGTEGPGRAGAHAEVPETCRARLEINPLRLFDCKVESCRELLGGVRPISEAVCGACRDHHAIAAGRRWPRWTWA